MKIATWNVNSIRVRATQVAVWLEENRDIDILCLQELKCQKEVFPHEIFEHLPYNIEVNAQPTRNGVAIFSKYPFEDIIVNFPDDPDSSAARFIQARVIINDQSVNIISVYVPNGENILSEKFLYKIKFLTSFKNYLETELLNDKKLIIAGDYNIAPYDIDVYDPLIMYDMICFSSLEKQMFKDILSLGLIDTYRAENACQEFSWWDYRTKAWPKNRGMRIDHILISNNLSSYLSDSYIDKTPRGNERPSDHTPVITQFNL